MKEHIKEVLVTVLKREVDDMTSQANCPEWDSLHHADIERLVTQKLGK